MKKQTGYFIGGIILFIIIIGIFIIKDISKETLGSPAHVAVVFFNETHTIPGNIVKAHHFTLLEEYYIDLDFSSNNLAKIYLVSSEEYSLLENKKEWDYLEGKHSVTEFNLVHKRLAKDKYHIVVMARDSEELEYNLNLVKTRY
jgi:hypothetical protein